ncbi:MAG: MerR family transcriptional regulator [Alphaproteobacteria bacterium PA2]|nr:MAG: MerR family transcriptional regulator [Alphaproteobacteria bacterium PA2]
MSAKFLRPSQAARRHGISPKALKLYEAQGLVTPGRTPAGWRAYGPDDLARVAEIAGLRGLGLSLRQVASVLAGDLRDLEAALADQQTRLEGQSRVLSGQIARLGEMRAGLARGQAPSVQSLTDLAGNSRGPSLKVTLTLPWPWDGERFDLTDIRALNFIIGPLGSGKTRLAQALARAIPGAVFLDPDRTSPGEAALAADPAWAMGIKAGLDWLAEDGARPSDALTALIAGLENVEASAIVVDMVEQGLDHASQEAVIAWLRRRGPGATPLFLMTRSSAILDLAAMGPDETLIYCPPNHSPPFPVTPVPGAHGYESVAACLGSPAVRARTANRPPIAP